MLIPLRCYSVEKVMRTGIARSRIHQEAKMISHWRNMRSASLVALVWHVAGALGRRIL